MSETKAKHIIKNVLIALVSLAMITGFVMLFIAASRDRDKSVCKGLRLELKGDPARSFVDKAAIEHMLRGQKALDPVGKPLSALGTAALEKAVKAFPWVKDAQLYVDNDNILQIQVTEREPVARVFTASGNSFFLDQDSRRLPVTGSFAVRIPVFTGFPDGESGAPARDSLLAAGITAISAYLSAHPFWMAQVEQVNINALGQFELVNTVGGALVEFGDATDIDQKFSKLLVFYRGALNHVGWGYYDTLDLRFRGQVVASRKPGNRNPVIDSLMTDDAYLPDPADSPAGKAPSKTAPISKR